MSVLEPSAFTNQPWASGPKEILELAISLLRKDQRDSGANRRLAMLAIDNSVELMIRAYLEASPSTARDNLEKAHFPELIACLQKLSCETTQVLAQIRWFHHLRNTLYHNGNGITVQRRDALEYAKRAGALFTQLFGFEIGVDLEPRERSRQPNLIASTTAA